MARHRLLAAAALASTYGSVYANPMPQAAFPAVCPNGIATLDVQPIKLVTVTPVLVSFFAPQNTDIVIDDNHTIRVTNGPIGVNTVLCYAWKHEHRRSSQ
ncbi:Uncharacterized protein TPAR_08434 [Tolypocladium paradoxum]|uniref:Uncharacterized protein n=1 Tax=Tolypocladium paradoxum TaxID=94208 RepID=A0A2S4KMD0_9HYPO|nr:Uncharacterized protein TPAR_08434 [Tolypocladium paradoxum]